MDNIELVKYILQNITNIDINSITNGGAVVIQSADKPDYNVTLRVDADNKINLSLSPTGKGKDITIVTR